jgi:hypothetical protein
VARPTPAEAPVMTMTSGFMLNIPLVGSFGENVEH